MSGHQIVQTVPAVGLAEVQPGAAPFKNNNINNTFIGLIETGVGRPSKAIIKDLPQKELANEVLAAALALSLGLPVPRPFLAVASSTVLPGYKAPLLSNGARVFFASELQGTPPVAQICTQAGAGWDLILDRLTGWAKLSEAFLFDTWVANTDRHMNNLLFDGNNAVWLIDHGRCFTGEAWVANSLRADGVYQNRLTEWLTPRLAPSQRAHLVREASTFPTRSAGVDLDETARANRVINLLSAGDLVSLLQFLKDRCQHVPLLATSAIGLPRLVP